MRVRCLAKIASQSRLGYVRLASHAGDDPRLGRERVCGYVLPLKRTATPAPTGTTPCEVGDRRGLRLRQEVTPRAEQGIASRTDSDVLASTLERATGNARAADLRYLRKPNLALILSTRRSSEPSSCEHLRESRRLSGMVPDEECAVAAWTAA